jgi:hypothetical protein
MPAGSRKSYSRFVPGSDALSPESIKAFEREIGGYPLNVSRTGTCTLLDINAPSFMEARSLEGCKRRTNEAFSSRSPPLQALPASAL